MSGPLVYLEYISRRPGRIARGSSTRWPGTGRPAGRATTPRTSCSPTSAARWRTGPEPEYLAFWYTPGQGLDRFDDWERIFRSGEADEFEEPFKIAARIERGGSYDPLFEPTPSRPSAPTSSTSTSRRARRATTSRAAYEERRDGASRADAQLRARPHRPARARPARARAVGPADLGPSRGDRPRPRRLGMRPVRLVDAGMYSAFGKETL